MYYVVNNNLFQPTEKEEILRATDQVEDDIALLYLDSPFSYKIENGKFIKIKDESELRANAIRTRRERECFPIINRGALWYEKLTEEQKTELSAWYEAWLDAPETGTAPEKPAWLENVAKQGGDTE